MASTDPAQKFDPARAGEYQAQSRIALAGYDACHELAACMLAAVVGPGTEAHVLVVGAGGGAQEPSVPMTMRHRPPGSLALRLLKDDLAHAHDPDPDRR